MLSLGRFPAYGSEAQGRIHRKLGWSWNLLLNLNVCQFLFKQDLQSPRGHSGKLIFVFCYCPKT